MSRMDRINEYVNHFCRLESDESKTNIRTHIKRYLIWYDTKEEEEKDLTKNTDYDRIVDVVLTCSGFTIDEVRSKKRNQPLIRARHIMCYMLRNSTIKSFAYIGKTIHKDHATVIFSCNQVADKLSMPNQYPEICELYSICVETLETREEMARQAKENQIKISE